jgi:hypothetical protein
MNRLKITVDANLSKTINYDTTIRWQPMLGIARYLVRVMRQCYIEKSIFTTSTSCPIKLTDGREYLIGIFDGSNGTLLSYEHFDFSLLGPIVAAMDETQVNDMIRVLTEQAAKYHDMNLQISKTNDTMETAVELSRSQYLGACSKAMLEKQLMDELIKISYLMDEMTRSDISACVRRLDESFVHVLVSCSGSTRHSITSKVYISNMQDICRTLLTLGGSISVEEYALALPVWSLDMKAQTASLLKSTRLAYDELCQEREVAYKIFLTTCAQHEKAGSALRKLQYTLDDLVRALSTIQDSTLKHFSVESLPVNADYTVLVGGNVDEVYSSTRRISIKVPFPESFSENPAQMYVCCIMNTQSSSDVRSKDTIVIIT